VDAVLLSKLAPADVVGWHAVARRLIGALVLPAALVMGALYPTLSRLQVEDRDAFVRTARAAIRATFTLAVPVSLCCALYADIGILIFSHKAYGAAKANLIVLSAFLLLTYLSMPLGASALAAGRQRAWAAAQFVCVAVSAALDPWLIPWFQGRMGNGGLGVCVAAVVSETLMVAAGVWLAPRALFDRGVNLTIVRSLGAGMGMAAAAFALSRLTPFIAAPVALCAYAAGLWASGGLSREQVALLRDAVRRKVARR
jgi:O-antigen/teichoic acid export membrane protein